MTVHHSSLRDATLSGIGNFLFEEKFNTTPIAREGILNLLNLISDYYEEGTRLFPEIVIMNNIDLLRTIPCRNILLYQGELTVLAFLHAIKLCAPLAINNWVIFIVIDNNNMQFGLTSAEISETSLSMFKQTIEMPNDGFNIAYIRNIGKKTVELAGLKTRSVIYLTLDETREVLKNEVFDLCSVISSKSEGNDSDKFTIFFEKIINEAIKIGHGNLISVINDDSVEITRVDEIFKNGIFLSEPINLTEMIKIAENSKTNLSSIELKSFTSIIISMLNHDGITLFSTNGKVLGYHFIVKNSVLKIPETSGGSRSIAFEAMKESDLFQACFMKSQDGNIKFFKK